MMATHCTQFQLNFGASSFGRDFSEVDDDQVYFRALLNIDENSASGDYEEPLLSIDWDRREANVMCMVEV